MTSLIYVFVVAIALLSNTATAQALVCLEDGTSQDSVRCGEMRAAVAERNLNASYTRLLAELKNGEESSRQAGALLVRAQREWVKFRELDCDAKYELRPDAGLRSWYRSNCRREHAEQRAAQLAFWNSD